MSFQSILFIILFGVFLVVLAVSESEKLRQYEILTASDLFYALWDIRFLLLIGICILVSHLSVAGIMSEGKTGGISRKFLQPE